MTVIINETTKGYSVSDRITATDANGMPAGIAPLALRPGMRIHRASVDGRELTHDELATLRATSGNGYLRLPTRGQEIIIEYSGELEAQWPWVTLLPGDAWYPISDESRVSFSLDVRIPAGWTVLTQAVPVDEVMDDHIYGQSVRQHSRAVTYRQTDPQQGIYLIAGPYVDYHRETAGYRARVMLREADAPLAGSYLDAALAALEDYSEVLGEYPYHNFTLVENQQQTGWGMPGFTLLGSDVIRLPFIVHTSFTHEIMHNWWGNGVFVDRSSGNWSEGLTTYLSDYIDRDRRGLARQYRLDTLITWDNFARRQEDFPLTDFTARHDRATQAVGYGKGLYLFHMLRSEVGDEQFLKALQGFYRQYVFEYAGFDEIRAVFESVCECSLGMFFRQWLYRSGAPRLTLEEVALDDTGGSVAVTLGQQSPPWRLRVPLRLVDINGDSHWRFMVLETARQSNRFAIDKPIARVDVDPDFDLFRILETDEKPATIGQLFASEQVVVDPADETFKPLAQAVVSGRDGWSVDPAGADAGGLILLGRNHPRAAEIFNQYFVNEDLILDGLQVELSDESVAVLADAYKINGRNRIVLWIAAQADARLPRLLRRLSHYGRQSYLLFDHIDQRARLSGQWETHASGLTRVLTDGPPVIESRVSKPLF